MDSPPPETPETPKNDKSPLSGLKWLWWLLPILLLWSLFALFAPQTSTVLALSYSAFLDEVRADNVKSVTIDGQKIDGTFKNGVVVANTNSSTPVSALPPTAGPAQTPATGFTTYANFNTVAPLQSDPNLLPLLNDHSVDVVVKDTSSGSLLTTILLTVVPLGLLVVFWLYISRNAQRGQQNIFGFAGSKARRYSEEKPSVTFEDVAGEEEAKQELQEIVDFLKKPAKYHALGARLPHGVLLVGPPGTGKTLLAKAVAGEAHVPFFSISASEFVEMFVGVGASRVRDLFTKAKVAAPAIVFIDELDAVGRQRGAGMGGGNDEREQTLNQLLVEMDGFDEGTNVIVLAATNRPDVLDPALLRRGRFDRQITVGMPDRRARLAILKVHTRRLPLGDDVDLDLLARRTPGFSGADLANLANEAALYAVRRDGKKITMQDFNEAMDKIVLGTRQAILMSEEEKRLVAYHESGHALVATLTPGSDPVTRVSIIPHGQSLGATQQLTEEERHNYPKDYLVGRLGVMLGGRTAEELVFGQPTTGAENDLKQATQLARRMVGLWGMDEELGPVSYGVGESSPFLGREIGQPREYAEATAAEMDSAVRHLVEQAETHSRDILEKHRAALDELAGQLLEHETVEKAQIDEIIARGQTAPVQPTAT